jgi:hypothetical protein
MGRRTINPSGEQRAKAAEMIMTRELAAQGGLARYAVRDALRVAANAIISDRGMGDTTRKKIKGKARKKVFVGGPDGASCVWSNPTRRKEDGYRIRSKKGMCVYVIGCDGRPTKIGIAQNVRKRLSQVQTGCPYELSIHYSIDCTAEDARLAERAAHRRLSAHRTSGEWFAVDMATAAQIVEEIVRRLQSRAAA